MWLLIAFVAVPLIEIALFIQLGGFLGLWPTLGIVVLTAFLGTWLVRSQGLAALQRLRSDFDGMRDPTEALAHGAMILFAGALLLTPGFFTDAVGFSLLIPAVRVAAFGFLRSQASVRFAAHVQTAHPAQPTRRDDGVTIEGDYQEIDGPTQPGQSGWTKH